MVIVFLPQPNKLSLKGLPLLSVSVYCSSRPLAVGIGIAGLCAQSSAVGYELTWVAFHVLAAFSLGLLPERAGHRGAG